jgi:hypothetical protein
VGLNGIILRTTDGGGHQTEQPSATANQLRGVDLVDSLTGTVVGARGTILHTKSGGITAIERTGGPVAPCGFALGENYPNPFNPSTTIDLSIGQRVAVFVGVYVVLGREVAVLLSGVKEPGAYRMRFTGSGLASGVYLCRMIADDLVQTRNMILAG